MLHKTSNSNTLKLWVNVSTNSRKKFLGFTSGLSLHLQLMLKQLIARNGPFTFCQPSFSTRYRGKEIGLWQFSSKTHDHTPSSSLPIRTDPGVWCLKFASFFCFWQNKKITYDLDFIRIRRLVRTVAPRPAGCRRQTHLAPVGTTTVTFNSNEERKGFVRKNRFWRSLWKSIRNQTLA